MNNDIILLEKEDFKIIKVNNLSFKIEFNIENKNLYLPSIINFNLIKLIYDLNPDIYEKVNLNIINNENAIASILIKNFFQDIGLLQKYSYLNITMKKEENKIIFISKSILNEIPIGMPENSELLKIENMISVGTIINDNKVNFDFEI